MVRMARLLIGGDIMPTFETSWPVLPLPAQRLQDARQAVEATTPPPADPASLVLADAGATATASCPECSGTFIPRTAGVPQRFCSSKCRVRWNARARRAKAEANGAADVAGLAPIAEWERPPKTPYSSEENPGIAAVLKPPPAGPWELREHR
jgi:hypothetical protein